MPFAFQHMACELAQPLPASFFHAIGAEETMDAVVEALYARQGDRLEALQAVTTSVAGSGPGTRP